MPDTYRHAEQTRGVMLEIEVLIGKGLCAVDRNGASAVAVKEVASLDHEVLDLFIGL